MTKPKWMPNFLASYVIVIIGLVLWAGFTGRLSTPKTEPDPCEKLTAESSPISILLRVVPGTSEQDYLKCARRHDQILVKIDKLADHPTRKPISEEELIRLSKMTQEERDKEGCQSVFKIQPWDSGYSTFDRIEKQITTGVMPNDSTTIKFNRATYAFCKRFR